MKKELAKRFSEEFIRLGDEERMVLLNAITEVKKKELRERYKDFYLFLKEVCKFEEMEVNPHRVVAEWLLEEDELHRLWLAPRDTFKSSEGTIGLIAWLITYDDIIFINKLRKRIKSNQTSENLYGAPNPLAFFSTLR